MVTTRAAALLVILLAAPIVLAHHDAPSLQRVDAADGAGWTRLLVAPPEGRLAFEVEAAATGPFVQRVDVLDAAGRSSLSVEGYFGHFSPGVRGGTSLADATTPRVWTGPRGASVLILAPACAGEAWVGGHADGWTLGIQVARAACLGPGPWRVVTYAVGEGVARRETRLLADAPVRVAEGASAQGGVFQRLGDARETVAVEAQPGDGHGETWAASATFEARTTRAWLGSFGAFQDGALGTLSWSTSGARGACPCLHHGVETDAGARAWRFHATGAKLGGAVPLYLAGVDVPW